VWVFGEWFGIEDEVLKEVMLTFFQTGKDEKDKTGNVLFHGP
jgi:hypothetical protein